MVAPASNPAIGRAPARLSRQQNPDGGFNFSRRGGASGIDDTAGAVHGLVAGGATRRGSGSPPAHLEGLAVSDGSVHYSASTTHTPVWVTAQALTGLAQRAFPLNG